MQRREFLKFATYSASVAVAANWHSRAMGDALTTISTNEFDYLVVGSGPGGAPLAVRLAQQGFSVGLIEAGGWDTSTLVETPAYHVMASEWDPVTWRFYVQHYTNEFLNRKNPKYNEVKKGVFYPRGSAVGGSSLVNAMISMMPSTAELEELARTTRDRQLGYTSWQKTYDRVLRSHDLTGNQVKPAQYLETRRPTKSFALKDRQFFEIVRTVFNDEQVPEALRGKIYQALFAKLDPNAKDQLQFPNTGPYLLPLNSTADGKRWGTRNLLQRALSSPQIKSKLHVIDRTLVTKLDLQPTNDPDRRYRCQGVFVQSGHGIYGASPDSTGQSGVEGYFKAKKEVILSGGSFNSPQMLQLSGIGDPEHLNQVGLEALVPLPMVGRNLQDRYEISVVSELPHAYDSLGQCEYNLAAENLQHADACFRDYEVNDVSSIYSTNGAIIGLKKKYKYGIKQPDLFIFANPGDFRGYQDGYSKSSFQTNKLSWVILKGYTANQSGQVLISSKDPLQPPRINFKYFNDGTELGDDYEAMQMGVRSVRAMNQRLATSLGAPMNEVYPAQRDLSDCIQYESWGHHASCSNKMGAQAVNPWIETADSVVNSQFQVHGVASLRIVDASVFPKIPGLFIGLPTFLLSEIAADKILKPNTD